MAALSMMVGEGGEWKGRDGLAAFDGNDISGEKAGDGRDGVGNCFLLPPLKAPVLMADKDGLLNEGSTEQVHVLLRNRAVFLSPVIRCAYSKSNCIGALH